MPALRLCLDCGTLSAKTRCPAHTSQRARQRDQRRGSSTARGYGPEHRATREKLLPLALGMLCPIQGPNCDGVMTDPDRMDLDHSDPAARLRGEPGDRITCAPCNRGRHGSR